MVFTFDESSVESEQRRRLQNNRSPEDTTGCKGY